MIETEDLSMTYGTLKALDGLNLKVDPGEFFAFLGPNAAGKSTLLRAVTGVVRPTSGQVTFDGRPVHRKAPRALAAHMAYVPQHPHVSAALRVRDVVELGPVAISMRKVMRKFLPKSLKSKRLQDRRVAKLHRGRVALGNDTL